MAASLFFSGSRYVQLAALPFVAPPALVGEYNLALIVIGYALNINFGLFNALPQYLPQYEDESPALVALRGLAPLNLALTVATGVAAIGMWSAGHPRLAAYLLVFLVNVYYNYLIQATRGLGQFFRLSALKIGMGASNMAVVVALVVSGYDAFLVAIVGSSLAVVLGLGARARGPMVGVPGHLDWPLVRTLLPIGFPIMLLGLIGALQLNVDRLLIGVMRPVEEVGYYSIGAVVLSTVLLVPGALFDLYYAEFARLYARGETRALRTEFGRQLVHTSLLAALLVAVGALVVPLLVRRFLPRYEPSIPVVYALLAASIALLVGNNFSNLYTATRQSLLSVVNTVVATGAGSIAVGMLLRAGSGLGAVGWASCGAALLFLALQVGSYRRWSRRMPASQGGGPSAGAASTVVIAACLGVGLAGGYLGLCGVTC